jgi:hypothetical protein
MNKLLILVLFYSAPLFSQSSPTYKTTGIQPQRGCRISVAGMTQNIKISKSDLVKDGSITLTGCADSTYIVSFDMVLNVNGNVHEIQSDMLPKYTSIPITPMLKDEIMQLKKGEQIFIMKIRVRSNNSVRLIPEVTIEITD